VADLEIAFKSFCSVELLWVPCFRQRDLAAAVRWGRRKKIPVVFDPLISAYDKQVFERKKFPERSYRARKLLRWERQLFKMADLLVADTCEHARYFSETLGADSNRIAVVPVGAEEEVFTPHSNDSIIESLPTVLFYGSFLNLQGPEVIIEAARKYTGPPVHWKLAGEGPLLDECRKQASGLANVEFAPWLPYEELPDVIHQAEILLGIFGTSAKAGRVIPNKVYQALACGKPLVTRTSPAYPASFVDNNKLGIGWVAAGDPQQLADKISELLTNRAVIAEMGRQARQTYETHFSMASISASLFSALQPLLQVER
jgi:glycosyltransferase involved in cell wall biosynthesis